MDKSGMLLFFDDLQSFSDLTDQEYGQLIRAAMKYELSGTLPTFSDRALKIAFNQIKIRNDLNRAKYEAISKARSEAGRKGGAPKGNQNARKFDSFEQRQRTPEEFEALEEKLMNR